MYVRESRQVVFGYMFTSSSHAGPKMKKKKKKKKKKHAMKRRLKLLSSLQVALLASFRSPLKRWKQAACVWQSEREREREREGQRSRVVSEGEEAFLDEDGEHEDEEADGDALGGVDKRRLRLGARRHRRPNAPDQEPAQITPPIRFTKVVTPYWDAPRDE
ncbi:hypothetical protein GW17_00032248 [Ensete ventricosum]|nr:hypothetical protein GW17_00032248 [Ensete ventricosum]